MFCIVFFCVCQVLDASGICLLSGLYQLTCCMLVVGVCLSVLHGS